MLVIYTGDLDLSSYLLNPDGDDGIVEIPFDQYSGSTNELSLKIGSDIKSFEVFNTMTTTGFKLSSLTTNNVLKVRLAPYKPSMYSIHSCVALVL